MGIGLAASKETDGRICSYVVARYFKAGNDLSTIRSNVARGSFHSCNRLDQNTRPTVRHMSSYSMSPRKHAKSTQKYKSGTHHTPTYGYRHITKRPSHFSYHSTRNHGYLEAHAGGSNTVESARHAKAVAGKGNQWYAGVGNEWKNTGSTGFRGEYIKTGKTKENFMDNIRYSPSHSYLKAYTSAGRGKHNYKDIEQFPTDGLKVMKSKPKFGYQSMHSAGAAYQTAKYGQENVYGYRGHELLSPERYSNRDSGDEFYFGNPQKTRPLQSQLKSKNFDNSMRFGSTGSQQRLGMPDESKHLLLPPMKSFHQKQKATPSTSPSHNLNKPTVAHRFTSMKHKEFAPTPGKPEVGSKQGSPLLDEWSKANKKPKKEESVSSVTSQNPENMLKEHEKNENGNIFPSKVKSQREPSKIVPDMDHGKEGRYNGHNKANHFHSDTQYSENKEYKMQSKRPMHIGSQQPPMHIHQKTNVKIDPGDSMKMDNGFLSGINAALAMGSSTDARDFYDEPKGLIDSSRAYAGIGTVQDLNGVGLNDGQSERGVELDKQIDLNSLREEGEKIEESLSDVGVKNSDQSFEEGLIKSVNQGRVDVSFEKRPEDYKMPSLLMDEYRYNTPENGKGENMYEGFSQELGEKMGKIASHERHVNASNKSSKERERLRKVHQQQALEGAQGNLKHEKPVAKFTHQQAENGHLASEMEGRIGQVSADYVPNKDRLNEKGNTEKEISFISSDKSGEHVSGLVNENKPLKSRLGFQTGFEDALSVMNGYDDGKVMDVAATKKEVLSRVPTVNSDRYDFEKSYDTSRTRHFVIDKSDNLVLTPGEETGPVTDYESKHLGDLTRQATYGVKSVAQMFKGDDLTGINSLQKIIPDQNDFRSGLIAWSGPYNPGLPNEEEIKQQSDISGQDLVERLEKSNDFKIAPMLNEHSTEINLHAADNFGNTVVKNDPVRAEADSGILKNASFSGDILSKFHNEYKNGSGLDDGLNQRVDGKEKKFVKFQGKIFDDDMKLLTEKNLEEDASSVPRTTKEGKNQSISFHFLINFTI